MTYAMTLDNSWELMSEDEMYDVNGGQTFTGLAAWAQITEMLAVTFGLFVLGGKLAAAATATVWTGIGTVIGILAAVGATASILAGIWDATNIVTAITFTVTGGGFNYNYVGLFGIGVYLVTGL